MVSLSAAYYATLHDVRRELKQPSNAGDPEGDRNALNALRAVTARIDEELPNQRFLPIIETRYYDAADRRFGGDVDGAELVLDADLISLTTLTNGEGTVITSDNYTLFPRSGPPYTAIRLVPTGGTSWQGDANGERRDQIEVAGIWASGSRLYGDWLTGVDTLGAAITTTTETTLTLTWTANTDPLLREPRFSPGMLVRISGSELGEILDASFQNQSLLVRRGARGSTATTHLNGATVDVWEVHPVIRQAAARWAMVVYKRMGRDTDSTFDAGSGIATKFAKDIPADVAGDLALFRPRKTGARMVAV